MRYTHAGLRIRRIRWEHLTRMQIITTPSNRTRHSRHDRSGRPRRTTSRRRIIAIARVIQQRRRRAALHRQHQRRQRRPIQPTTPSPTSTPTPQASHRTSRHDDKTPSEDNRTLPLLDPAINASIARHTTAPSHHTGVIGHTPCLVSAVVGERGLHVHHIDQITRRNPSNRKLMDCRIQLGCSQPKSAGRIAPVDDPRQNHPNRVVRRFPRANVVEDVGNVTDDLGNGVAAGYVVRPRCAGRRCPLDCRPTSR